MRWMVTGAAGFIGSRFVRRALERGWAEHIVALDALTYAGHLANLEPYLSGGRLTFVHGDVRRPIDVQAAMGGQIDRVVHFAAESHVDRSIADSSDFVSTNVLGTQVVLEALRERPSCRLLHISTDEVYGSLGLDEPRRFEEDSPLCPSSPYAASKAAADLLVLAFASTHRLDAVITRCSNNYGPHQLPEKFIPLFITQAMAGQPMPLYGDGKNVRDWVHVDDHVDGLHLALTRGERQRVYNLGGDCERPNRTIAQAILQHCGAPGASIVASADRLGHDRRYAVDCSRARRELGFAPGPSVEQRLGEVVDWYRQHPGWWRPSAQLQAADQGRGPLHEGLTGVDAQVL